MAIIVEEEQKSHQGLTGIIVWGLVFVIAAVAVYYVFFKRPDLVEVVTPSNFTDTEVLSRINLAPDEVINSESFRALRPYAPPLTATPGGRANPFLGSIFVPTSSQ